MKTSKRTLILWLFVLSLLLLTVSTSDHSEGDEESIEVDDESDAVMGNATVMEVRHNEQEEEEEAAQLDEEEATQIDEEEEEPTQTMEEFLEFQQAIEFSLTPDMVYNEIIGGVRANLPNNIIAHLSPEQLTFLIKDPLGARLVAGKYMELIPDLIGFLDVNDFNEEFFKHLPVFFDDDNVQIEQIPAIIICSTVRIQSMYRMLNLRGFIEKFENFDHQVALTLDPVYILPHLFNLERVHNPSFYLARGLTFNPDQAGSRKDFILWNISAQLFIYNIIHRKGEFDFEEIVGIALDELKRGHEYFGEESRDLKINYFGIEEDSIFKYSSIFNTETPLLLRDNPDMTISTLSASLGLPTDFESINYVDLSSDLAIIYRLVVYIAIFNPTLIDEVELDRIIVNLVSVSKPADFSQPEFDFFVSSCFRNGLSNVIAKIFNVCSDSSFRRAGETILLSDRAAFDRFVGRLSNVGDRLSFLGIWNRHPLDSSIILTDENFYSEAQMKRMTSSDVDVEADVEADVVDDAPSFPLVRTKRLVNGDSVQRSTAHSHFLTSSQLTSLLRSFPSSSLRRQKITFTVPYPDANFFNDRIDNLLQNVNSPDFGEKAWADRIAAIEDPLAREQYARNEPILHEFVLETFKAAYKMYKEPTITFNIQFTDHEGYGEGPTREALELLSRALLLPRYKIFHYNTRIVGFVPYPLLHPDIMGVLGYINAWFIRLRLSVNWHLPVDYIQFLFYEEDPNAPMQDVIEHLYPDLFKNIDALLCDSTNPLDYFTTTFHSHSPFPFSDGTAATPLDLYAPHDSSSSQYSSLSMFLSGENVELLDEIIQVPAKRCRHFEETKGESSREECSPEEIDLEMRYSEQVALKREIVDAIKQAVSLEIIDHLLLGRFSFIRQFLRSFNKFAQSHVNSHFYSRLQEVQNVEIQAEDIISGLNYQNERLDIQIRGNEDEILTPKQALELILQSYSPKMLRAFYWFCTGCSSLPLNGLAQYPIGVHVTGERLLPSAATCFRLFRFHTQPTLAANLGALQIALTESSGYHYIENRSQVGAAASSVERIANALANVAMIPAPTTAGEENDDNEDDAQNGDVVENDEMVD